MARILGIDYGSKRVGIAATDPLQMIAQAVATIPSHEVMHWLKSYMLREQVETILVGEARNLDGSATHSTMLISDFVKGLKKAFPDIRIITRDERFTSKIAFQAMLDSGMKKKQRQNKENIDKISATIILQEYLEENKNK